MKIYICKNHSVKSKSDYVCLSVEIGGSRFPINFKNDILSLISGLSVQDIMSLPVGTALHVGDLDIKKDIKK